MSLFHALNHPLNWLGLDCEMLKRQRYEDFDAHLADGAIIIMETHSHVIVVYARREDGTLIFGDPEMRETKEDKPEDNYKLKHTGRIWVVRRQRRK